MGHGGGSQHAWGGRGRARGAKARHVQGVALARGANTTCNAFLPCCIDLGRRANGKVDTGPAVKEQRVNASLCNTDRGALHESQRVERKKRRRGFAAVRRDQHEGVQPAAVGFARSAAANPLAADDLRQSRTMARRHVATRHHVVQSCAQFDPQWPRHAFRTRFPSTHQRLLIFAWVMIPADQREAGKTGLPLDALAR